jgi:hypothetical protein
VTTIITYPANSAYHTTPQSSNRILYWAFRSVPVDPTDQPYVLSPRHEYRPDKLAYELYNNPSYWWIFAVRNPFLRANPIWDFIGGLQIMVPTADRLITLLGA